jgi:hypothetical protein
MYDFHGGVPSKKQWKAAPNQEALVAALIIENSKLIILFLTVGTIIVLSHFGGPLGQHEARRRFDGYH